MSTNNLHITFVSLIIIPYNITHTELKWKSLQVILLKFPDKN